MGTSIVPDRAPEVLHPGEGVQLCATADESESGGDPTVPVTVNLLHGVRDSTNGFDLLGSVAGALCSILENCKV